MKPEVNIVKFTVSDILAASGGENPSDPTNPTGPIDPELPPDDDFD